MILARLAETQPAVQLLQRSLECGRLGHAYLFTGDDLEALTRVAAAMAQTLSCQQPPRRSPAGLALDACGQCLPCRKIAEENHPDVYWLRPESKSRIISVDQTRELIRVINLKPTEATHKVAVLVAADRLKEQAANAFLKTLEEPPSNSVIILLATEPQRLLETILSRCLRLNLSGGGPRLAAEVEAWLREFAQTVAAGGRSLLDRYRILGSLSLQLTTLKESIEKRLSERSPLAHHEDADHDLVERWENELKAAIEAEYRRQRADLLLTLEWWLRDLWLAVLGMPEELIVFPALGEYTRKVAARLKPEEAMENLAVIERVLRMLHTNAQEALVIEVGLLKMNF